MPSCDDLTPEDLPTPQTMPVLCMFRVWSAFKDLGFVDGAKMIHVARVQDVPYEFEIQMEREAKRGHKFLGIESPSRWMLLRYQPYCGREKF